MRADASESVSPSAGGDELIEDDVEVVVLGVVDMLVLVVVATSGGTKIPGVTAEAVPNSTYDMKVEASNQELL